MNHATHRRHIRRSQPSQPPQPHARSIDAFKNGAPDCWFHGLPCEIKRADGRKTNPLSDVQRRWHWNYFLANRRWPMVVFFEEPGTGFIFDSYLEFDAWWAGELPERKPVSHPELVELYELEYPTKLPNTHRGRRLAEGLAVRLEINNKPAAESCMRKNDGTLCN